MLPLLAELANVSFSLKVPFFVVGGAIRDLLLRRRAHDLDVAIEGSAEMLGGVLHAILYRPSFQLLAQHHRFGTATVRTPSGLRLDLAVARKEIYQKPAALPVVTGDVPIREDLERRDFTIHAMARKIGVGGRLQRLLDPFGGREDLEKGVLTLLHAGSLVDDPTRAFRAARYKVRLGFQFEPAFFQRLKASREAGAFQAISGDRLRRSIEEILLEERTPEAWRLLGEMGLLDDVAPGWGKHDGPLLSFYKGESLAERWTHALEPLPVALLRRVADRLNFPRKLRSLVGASR